MASGNIEVTLTANTAPIRKELSALSEHLNKLRSEAKPLFARLTDMFSGRCTFFAVVFTIVGIILAFMGKLTSEYVALVGAIQVLLVAHSAKEDYHERNSGDTNASV